MTLKRVVIRSTTLKVSVDATQKVFKIQQRVPEIYHIQFGEKIIGSNIGMPPGGASGHVLTKLSATDYHTGWVASTGGGSGLGIYFNAKDYGAIGDGSTDDHASLELCGADASAAGGTMYVPEGDYATTATVSIPAGCSVIMDGRIVYTGASNVTALEIGSDGVSNTNRNMQVRVYRETVSDWQNEASIGVEFINPNQCIIWVNEASRFTIGARFHGNTAGCAYNATTLGHIGQNKIGVDLWASDGGWANENKFFGGRFSQYSTGVWGDIDNIGVRISMDPYNTNYNNANTFYGPSFEINNVDGGTGIPTEFLVEHGGSRNAIYDARVERGAEPNVYAPVVVTKDHFDPDTGDFVAQAFGNKFTATILNPNDVTRVDDQGTAPSTTFRYRKEDLQTDPITSWNSGNVSENAYWRSGGVAFKGMHVVDRSNDGVYESKDDISVVGSTVILSVNSGIGVFVDTNKTKRIMVSKDVSAGAGGRIMVRCYSSSGSILQDAGSGATTEFTYLKAFNRGVYYSGTPKAYLESVDNENQLVFEVGPTVTSVGISINNGTVPALVKGFSIASVDVNNSITVFGGVNPVMGSGSNYDQMVSNESPGLSTAGIVGKLGTFINHLHPSEANGIGWICSSSGTPGTWLNVPFVDWTNSSLDFSTSGSGYFGGDLIVDGSFQLDSVNEEPTENKYIFFGLEGTGAGPKITWLADGTNRFYFNRDIYISGQLQASGALKTGTGLQIAENAYCTIGGNVHINYYDDGDLGNARIYWHTGIGGDAGRTGAYLQYTQHATDPDLAVFNFSTKLTADGSIGTATNLFVNNKGEAGSGNVYFWDNTAGHSAGAHMRYDPNGHFFSFSHRVQEHEILPDQSGIADGDYLSTDGTDSYWHRPSFFNNLKHESFEYGLDPDDGTGTIEFASSNASVSIDISQSGNIFEVDLTAGVLGVMPSLIITDNRTDALMFTKGAIMFDQPDVYTANGLWWSDTTSFPGNNPGGPYQYFYNTLTYGTTGKGDMVHFSGKTGFSRELEVNVDLNLPRAVINMYGGSAGIPGALGEIRWDGDIFDLSDGRLNETSIQGSSNVGYVLTAQASGAVAWAEPSGGGDGDPVNPGNVWINNTYVEGVVNESWIRFGLNAASGSDHPEIKLDHSPVSAGQGAQFFINRSINTKSITSDATVNANLIKGVTVQATGDSWALGAFYTNQQGAASEGHIYFFSDDNPVVEDKPSHAWIKASKDTTEFTTSHPLNVTGSLTTSNGVNSTEGNSTFTDGDIVVDDGAIYVGGGSNQDAGEILLEDSVRINYLATQENGVIWFNNHNNPAANENNGFIVLPRYSSGDTYSGNQFRFSHTIGQLGAFGFEGPPGAPLISDGASEPGYLWGDISLTTIQTAPTISITDPAVKEFIGNTKLRIVNDETDSLGTGISATLSEDPVDPSRTNLRLAYVTGGGAASFLTMELTGTIANTLLLSGGGDITLQGGGINFDAVTDGTIGPNLGADSIDYGGSATHRFPEGLTVGDKYTSGNPSVVFQADSGSGLAEGTIVYDDQGRFKFSEPLNLVSPYTHTIGSDSITGDINIKFVNDTLPSGRLLTYKNSGALSWGGPMWVGKTWWLDKDDTEDSGASTKEEVYFATTRSGSSKDTPSLAFNHGATGEDGQFEFNRPLKANLAVTTTALNIDDPVVSASGAVLSYDDGSDTANIDQNFSVTGALSVSDTAFANAVSTNTVGEGTSDTGVTVDGLLIKDGAIPTYDGYLDDINERATVDNEPTGFPNRTDSTFSIKDSTRAFKVSPASTSFDVWVKGTKYTFTTDQTVIFTDTEGLWFFYFDDTGTLIASQTFSGALITDSALVAVCYWDAYSDTTIYLGEERHGLSMSGDTHKYLHKNEGARIQAGCGLGDLTTDGNGSLEAHATMSTASGELADEDIEITITGASSPAQIPVFFLDGTAWRKTELFNWPVKNTLDGRVNYNLISGGSGSQVEVANNGYVLTHIFVTNNNISGQQYIAIQGQDSYLTKAQARAGAATEINTLYLGDLPFSEFSPVGTVIYKTASAMTNTPKCATQTDGEGNDYVSWVNVTLSPGSGPGDHNNLLNVGVNNHDTIDTHIDGDGSDHADVAANTVHAALVDEHIDWTDASSSVVTTGEVTAADFNYGSSGIARVHTINFTDMGSTYNWTDSAGHQSAGTTSAYSYIQSSLASGPAQWVTAPWLVPADWKTGTAISIDIGFGASSGTAGNVDIEIIPVAHSFNISGDGDESNYLGREYSSDRSDTINLTDVPASPQTFVVKEGVELTSDGSLGTGDIAPGDQLIIQYGFEPSSTGALTSTTIHNVFCRVHYTATSTKDS